MANDNNTTIWGVDETDFIMVGEDLGLSEGTIQDIINRAYVDFNPNKDSYDLAKEFTERALGETKQV